MESWLCRLKAQYDDNLKFKGCLKKVFVLAVGFKLGTSWAWCDLFDQHDRSSRDCWVQPKFFASWESNWFFNFLSFRNCEQRYFLLLSFVRSHSFPSATDSSAAKWTILQESKGPSIVTCSPHWRPSGTRFKSHGLEQYSPRVPCLPADAVCRCRACCCCDQIGAMTSDQIFIRTAHCKKVPRLNEICNHVEAKIFKNK